MFISLILILFATFATFSSCQNVTESPIFNEFADMDHWNELQEICNDEKSFSEFQDSICLTYIHNFQIVHMEILSWEPALVIYRDLLSTRQVDDYLEFLKEVQFEEQLITDDKGVSTVSDVRRANGSFIVPENHPASKSIFQSVKSMIPAMNFDAAEDFTALSYEPGGHYAVHFDYFDYKNEEDWDDWMKHFGNRMATLMMVFKTANGGATVFPELEVTVRPNVGDGIFWFNAKGDGSQEPLSAHGGCPIHSGNKIITTIWVRMAHQHIFEKIDNPESISAELLIPGPN